MSLIGAYHNLRNDIGEEILSSPETQGVQVESLMQRPLTLPHDARLDEAMSKLQEPQSHCILILREDGRLLGVFREEDVLKKVFWSGVKGDEPVSHFIEQEFCTLPTNADMSEVLNIMGQRGLRYLPIVDQDGFPKGIFSIRELIYFISERTKMVDGRFQVTQSGTFGDLESAIVEVLNLPITFPLSRYGYNDVVRMKTGDSVNKAIELFRDSSQAAGLMYSSGKLHGLFRLRDLPFRVLHQRSDLGDLPAEDFMTPLSEAIKEEETIGAGLDQMARLQVLYLHYQVGQESEGLVTGGGIVSYLYDHIHDDL